MKMNVKKKGEESNDMLDIMMTKMINNWMKAMKEK